MQSLAAKERELQWILEQPARAPQLKLSLSFIGRLPCLWLQVCRSSLLHGLSCLTVFDKTARAGWPAQFKPSSPWASHQQSTCPIQALQGLLGLKLREQKPEWGVTLRGGAGTVSVSAFLLYLEHKTGAAAEGRAGPPSLHRPGETCSTPASLLPWPWA